MRAGPRLWTPSNRRLHRAFATKAAAAERRYGSCMNSQDANSTNDGQIAPGAFAAPATSSPRGADDLHVCPECSAEMVYPTDWAPTADQRWSVDLRCPSCEWVGGGVYAQDVVDRFDEALDVATETILADLQALAKANMEEEIERFVYALDSGLILPDDF